MITSADVVYFGQQYSYEYDTRTIVDSGPSKRSIPLSAFTSLLTGRRVFLRSGCILVAARRDHRVG
jgi:hypothetical protein